MSDISFQQAALISFFRTPNGSVNHLNSLSRLKSDFSYPEKCYVVDRLPERLQNMVYGIPFPKNFSELGEGYSTFGSDDLIKEMNWALLTIRKHCHEFIDFIQMKADFETAFMKAYYRDAAIILDKIEYRYGQSMWLIEVRLLLKEIDKGLAENKLYLSEITEVKGGHFVSSIADLMSKKVEKERSTNRYAVEFKNLMSRSTFGAKNTEYYFFKANIYGLVNYNYRPTILAVEQKVALIDRYLTLLTCLRQHIANDTLSESNKRELSGRIYYLFRKLRDPQLIKLQSVLIDFFPETLSADEKWAHQIINYYTAGNYDRVIEECQDFLKDHWQNFDLYHVYCKALVNSGKIFSPLPGNETFINEILRNVYGLIKNEDDPELYVRVLNKIALQLSSFSIGDQIMNFLYLETDNDGQYFKQSMLRSPLFLPSMGRYTNEKTFAIKYFDHYKFLLSNQNDLTISFLQAVAEKDLNKIKALAVPDYRKLFYEALVYESQEQFEDAIAVWTHLKNCYSEISHIFKSTVEHLFFCYLKTKHFEDALIIYVDAFFTNPYCIIRLRTEALEEELRKSKMRSVEKTINLPLFFAIANSKKTVLSNAVELYFKKCGVVTPSQYTEGLKEGTVTETDTIKVFYFLQNVCTMSLFTHMVKIKGSKNKLQERLNVCIYLLNNEMVDADAYIDEIDDIERELLIQEGLQEYDESKIFINDKMIKENLLKELEADYNRYRKYGSLFKQYPRIKVLINTALFDIDADRKRPLDSAVFSEDPLYDQFKQMFLELRDKFLFSQYGLMEFLSGRIRHGVFKSEIRPKFEKLELITERDANTGVYKQSEYWKAKLDHLPPNTLSIILTLQTAFSKKIDDLIEDDALKKYLQIKVEKKNIDGWFDYEYPDFELAVIYASIQQKIPFDQFVDKCFAFLYVKTDANLADIRQKITGEYSEKFETVISEFEISLRELVNENHIHELLTKINDIKAIVQNDLNKVATWFNRSGSVTRDFVIDKIIEMSLRHTNRGYAKKEISLTRHNGCDRWFKGEFYPYFIDLIRVFFVNILEHNDAVNGLIPAELTITEQWPILKISISNEISETGKECATMQYAKVDEGRSQTEGKSGFPKVKRILKSYLGDNYDDNHLEFSDRNDDKYVVDCYINIEDLVVS
jgi:hypothetical protein